MKLYVIKEDNAMMSELMTSEVFPKAFRTYRDASEWLLEKGYKVEPFGFGVLTLNFVKEGEHWEYWICEIVEVEL